MKALVTGGAGFVGSHVVRRLVTDGVDVRVLHLAREDLSNLRGIKYEPFAGDLTDADAVTKAVKGCDWVFHVAALYALWVADPQRMWDVNVEGTRNIMRAAEQEGVRRVIHTSTVGVFGGHGPDVDATERSDFGLRATGDLYCLSKYGAHKVALEFASRGLDVVIAAPCGPVGPGDIAPTPTGRFLLSMVNLPVCMAVNMVGNWIDVRDLAVGHVLAATKGRAGESYILGNENRQYRDVAASVIGIAGLRKPIVTLPNTPLGLFARADVLWSNYITHRAPIITPEVVAIQKLGLRADCTKAFAELGLSCTPLETSFRDALIWFAQNGYIKNRRAARNLVAD